jgi:hypothetical protein
MIRHVKSVRTLSGTNYRVGEKLGNPAKEVSDITIDYEDTPHEVEVWVLDNENEGEKIFVIIPYHAVELLVK